MGETDKVNLQAALERTGWRVKRHESNDWWIHESGDSTCSWNALVTGIRVK